MSISAQWSRENLAWAGGLFDGEGCFSIKKNGPLVARLEMTDEDVVRKFHLVIGMGSVCGPRKYGIAKKESWCWTLSRTRHVLAFAFALWFFLGNRRRAKIEEMLGHFSANFPRSRKRTHCLYGHEFTETNTFWSMGHRSCRACGRRRSLEFYHKKKNKNGAGHLHESEDCNSEHASSG